MGGSVRHLYEALKRNSSLTTLDLDTGHTWQKYEYESEIGKFLLRNKLPYLALTMEATRINAEMVQVQLTKLNGGPASVFELPCNSPLSIVIGIANAAAAQLGCNVKVVLPDARLLRDFPVGLSLASVL